MIGIHIVSHGEICTGILNSLQMIVGEVEKIGYTKLDEESDVEDYREEMLKESKKLDDGSGVLIFADMFGATPYNTALFNSKNFESEKYKIVAGFNLPILIDAVMNRENMTLVELVENIKSNMSESIVVT